MADCENILTYNYKVTLPIDEGSPPQNYFQVSFFCNGVTYTSDTFNTADAALMWAQTNLSDFGTWSLDTDGVTLLLTGSLCENGELAYEMEDAVQVYGCTIFGSSNFDPNATINDGSCIPVVNAVGGCTKSDATNYNASATFDDGSCTFAPPIVITLDVASKKAVQTKIGACLFQKYDKKLLPSFTAKGIELNFGIYYLTFGSISSADATVFNTFLSAVGAQSMVYLSLKASNTFNDWMVSTFSAVAAAADQESELSSKGITNAQYTAWLQSTVTRYSPLPIVEDSAPIYSTSPTKVNRNLALAPLTYTTLGRQYEQLAPDRMVFSATDQDYNLSLINNYFKTTLPNDLTKFFATLPNVTQIVVEQWHNVDTGKQKPSDAISNFAIAEMARFTLANTEKFKYLFWMRFAEIVHGTHIEFDALKLVSPAFRFAFTCPVTTPYSGVNAQAFTDGANSFGILFTNQSMTTYSIAKTAVMITGKTVSGSFTRSSVYATDFYSTPQTETTSEASITIKPCSSTWVTFTTI